MYEACIIQLFGTCRVDWCIDSTILYKFIISLFFTLKSSCCTETDRFFCSIHVLCFIVNINRNALFHILIPQIKSRQGVILRCHSTAIGFYLYYKQFLNTYTTFCIGRYRYSIGRYPDDIGKVSGISESIGMDRMISVWCILYTGFVWTLFHKLMHLYQNRNGHSTLTGALWDSNKKLHFPHLYCPL